MTNEELNAIQARADAATPGPWRCERDITEEVGPWQIRTDVPELDDPMLPLALAGTCDDDTGDAAFIAAARTECGARVGRGDPMTTKEAIIAYLRVHPDGAKASEMALALGRRRVSVSNRITDLQRNGLVVRARTDGPRYGGVVWRLVREGDALGVQKKGDLQREAEERLRREWASFRRVVLRPLLDTLEQQHDPASREMRAAALGLADAMEGVGLG